MKMRYAISVALLMVTIICNAQDRVTKFLGIPVDGSKSDMINKLEDKGFSYSGVYGDEFLYGEFNGTDVQIGIVTNNNKVWRIFIKDEFPIDEYQIKLRFNTLCRQFERNSKYAYFRKNQRIPMDEDIDLEMTVSDKRYEASYFQVPPEIKGELIELFDMYPYLDMQDSVETERKLELLESIVDALLPYDEGKLSKYDRQFFQEILDKNEFVIVFEIYADIISILCDRLVWFTIDKGYGGYYILMYYDNIYNKASGEDL